MNQIETFFDTMAERWDAVCVHDPEKIRTILDRTNLRRNARILDVGCGTGILESYLLPYEPRQIVAIDIAGQMIEKARVKYPDHPLIEFLQEDAMSYKGKGFDYIILYSAYPHFMRPERLIKHMSDLLVPGGKLVICHSESKEKINTHHHRHADLGELRGEVEVALDVHAVHDVQDRGRLLVHEEVARDLLLQRVGGERVDARQILHDDVLVPLEPAVLLLHRHARPVPDVLVGSRQLVEERRLAAVRVARKRNLHCSIGCHDKP